MAEIDNAVIANVAAFLERLKSAGMQIAGAYLFGSHLTGKADEWSDIDVAVISPQIGSDRFEEPLPFSPDNFTPDDPLVREILRTGLRV
ncbi:nucleotidyltransferase domain-containing protein [Candidatus Electronema sp. JM]|uniref:nucleotidyltransferase domain-containing protein n=1 Tax=Candidatus Electronema sp. JM TaxID=3401571 RepID=UPI003AA8C57F